MREFAAGRVEVTVGGQVPTVRVRDLLVALLSQRFPKRSTATNAACETHRFFSSLTTTALFLQFWTGKTAALSAHSYTTTGPDLPLMSRRNATTVLSSPFRVTTLQYPSNAIHDRSSPFHEARPLNRPDGSTSSSAKSACRQSYRTFRGHTPFHGRLSAVFRFTLVAFYVEAPFHLPFHLD